MNVTSKFTVGDSSCHSDNTLDHSQKGREGIGKYKGVARSHGFFVRRLAMRCEGGEKVVTMKGAPLTCYFLALVE